MELKMLLIYWLCVCLQDVVYSICNKTYNDGADASCLCPDHADLLADKYEYVVVLTHYAFIHSDKLHCQWTSVHCR